MSQRELNLANILQARITSNFEVADGAAYGAGTFPDRNTAIATALAMRADYRSAASQVRAAECKSNPVKASRLPTLGLRVGRWTKRKQPGEQCEYVQGAGPDRGSTPYRRTGSKERSRRPKAPFAKRKLFLTRTVPRSRPTC